MKNKLFFAWLGIIVICLIPVLLWFLGNTDEFTNSFSHSLGELTALVAMTMFALTFILSTRISFIEDIFGGLDKVYTAHGILGGTALIFILAHPILLVVKFIPTNIKQAAAYLLPSSHWSVNLGIVALLGLVVLIGITLFTKIKYNKWKFSHEFLGLVFIFAVFHIFLVRGDASADNIFNGYYWYAGIVSLVGLFGFSYSLFIKDRIFKAAKYKICVIKKEKNCYRIELEPEHKPISYKSGQFVFIRFFNEKLSRESHPFSIASKTNDVKLKVIIKALGDFTSQLEHLKVGDIVSVEGPYGRFNHKECHREQVWIAGGIGITPFIGMAEDLQTGKCRIDLYYSARDEESLIGIDELKEIESKASNFKVIPWLTKEKGYIRIEDITRISGKLDNKEFYICGPKQMKNDLVEGLLKLGINKENIHEEDFDFR